MLNPLMLLGLLALGIPVVIHLIQRQKLQPRLLATLRFLEETDVANAFAPVPRDLLQLMLRLLLLAVFVFLMARLALPSSRLGARTMTVVLDGSMSMQAAASPQSVPGPNRQAGSVFDQHRDWVRGLIESMGADDQMALMLVDDAVRRETGFLRDKGALRNALDGFEVTDASGRVILPAIERALATSASIRRGTPANTCVLVFSDHQRVNYADAAGGQLPAKAPAASAQAERIRSILGRGRVKLFLVGLPADKVQNVAVQDAWFTPRRAYIGSSAKVTARVRNWSAEKQDVTVGFAQGPNAGESRPLSLDAGETASVDLAHFFESSQDSACRVLLGEPGSAGEAGTGTSVLPASRDALSADNIFYVPMRMQERRQVLLVAPPSAAPEGAMRASAAGPDLLGYALNPGEALGLGTGTNVSVKRITPNLIERVPLPLYSAVLLYAVSELPERSVKDLVAYVKSGGGLHLIVDGTVARERFNDTFAPLLEGFRLGGWKEPQEPLSLDTNEATLTEPMLLPLVRQEWGETRDLRFSAYFVPQAHGKAKCALRTGARSATESAAAGASRGEPASGGQPAGEAAPVDADWLMATIRLERGCVCVQLFSCDLADTTVPRSAVFVPMVQEVLAHLAPVPAEFATDAIHAGEVARMELPELRGVTGPVDLTGPAECHFDLLADEPGVVQVQGISRAGIYAVSHAEKQGMRPRWLAVNPVSNESDLTAASDAEIAQSFGRAGVERISHEALGAQFTRRREVLPVALALVFAAFVLEATVGAWQSVRKGKGRR